MMADHLGQNDVHNAPFTATWLSSFVFMPVFQKACQFRSAPKLMSSGGISCPQAHPSLADGQKKFVKYSVSKICHSRAGEAQEWQLVDSSHFSSTVCCQEIVHVLTASSVCLPPEYTGEKISLVCEQISDKSSKQCHQHFFCLQYQSSARNLFWDLGFFFFFCNKEAQGSFTILY